MNAKPLFWFGIKKLGFRSVAFEQKEKKRKKNASSTFSGREKNLKVDVDEVSPRQDPRVSDSTFVNRVR